MLDKSAGDNAAVGGKENVESNFIVSGNFVCVSDV